ncbi:hypothetical protein BS50DRAFT_570339 [Corynespora cassiicola Philippines]|uniref:NAD(P)-binding domain-containing protein n=1 Tax=Corynespora cassiicola Philippines TaxID=1448308 RepID=A0A2T2NZS0_CORCC|nr:hypothetical protein BS50DRAFT_570339 [Corynespora cassiicola Philippines]
MKLIVAGPTGFVGGEIFFTTLQHPSVTSVVSLSRRAVTDPRIQDNKKWENIVVEDFEQYPDDIMARLQGAVGCIWAIGGLANKFPNYETLHKANVAYPIAAAQKFAEALAPKMERGHRFRFVFTSGAMAERDQQKQLWSMRDSRLVKGEAELGLLDIAKSMPDSFETLIARPGFVLGRGDFKSFVFGLAGQKNTISVQDLAFALVDMVIHGSDVFGGKNTFDNLSLVRRAQKLQKA